MSNWQGLFKTTSKQQLAFPAYFCIMHMNLIVEKKDKIKFDI